MAKSNVDRYVKVTRRFDSSSKPYFDIALFSENPHEPHKLRTHKQFVLSYETGNRAQAELYAYKLAKCLECRVVE